MLARLLVLPLWLFLISSAAAIDINLPQPAHGLHFTNSVQVWDEALPLGDGILGALVWGDGRPLKISLDRTDLWDLTPVPEFHSADYRYDTMRQWHDQGRHNDLIRLYEAPYNRPAPTKIPAGRIELTLPIEGGFVDTSLSLSNAMAEMRFKGGARVRVFLHAVDPVGLIQIRLPSTRGLAAKLLPPPFAGKVVNGAKGGIGAGDLAQLGYPPPVLTSGSGWQAFTQRGAQGFHFAAYLAWREVRGEWVAAWSVASSFEGTDPLALAKKRVEAALKKGFDGMARSHVEWWQAWWRKSSLQLPNPVVERQWFLDQYKFAAASRRGAPPITLQGPWTADDGQLPPWKGDYHHDLNTELSYWPCYSGNHLDEGLGYLDWLWTTRSNCVDWTQRFFGLPGLNVPMTGDLDNSQIGGWRQYTHSATTAAWLAQHFYWHWKYSADRKFLKERAWPYLRDASVFIEAITARKDSSGHRTLPLSASPEIHDNSPQAWWKEFTNYDLALVRWLLQSTAELADELRLPEESQRWRRVLGEMPDFAYAGDGRFLVAPGEPLKESHRHFSHLMAIHPLGLTDVSDGPAARRTVEASLKDLERLGSGAWCGYSFAWLANLAARAHDGAKAESALEIFSTAFTLRNSFHCNGDQSGKGYSGFRYRPFTLEGNFAAAAGTQEMLLQSHRGRIEVFPAIPPSWRDVSFTTLRAQGAFLVSAERRDGLTRRVEIESEKGGSCRLLSPWSGRDLVLAMKPGEKIVLTRDPAGQKVGVADRAACSTLCQAKQSTEKAFQTIAALGFHNLDLSCLSWAPHVSVPRLLEDFDKEAGRVESLLAANGLHAANLTFDAVESRPFELYEKEFSAVVKLAARLHARLINIMAPSAKADRADQVAKLRKLQAIASRQGVLLTLETHVGQVTERPADARWMCEQVPGIGLTLDPSHYFAGPHQGADFNTLLPLVQGTGFRAGGMNWSQVQMPWGEGPIDFAAIERGLEAAGYQGFYACEYIEGFNQIDAVEESRRYLAWARHIGIAPPEKQ